MRAERQHFRLQVDIVNAGNAVTAHDDTVSGISWQNLMPLSEGDPHKRGGRNRGTLPP